MKSFFTVIGVLLFMVGIIAGIYVGFWVMLVGGIVDIINAIKMPITTVSDVGWGALKIAFAGFTGGLTFWFCTFIAGVFIAAGD